MLKLAKYLKPFAGAIIIAIALLFVQAMCDLSLPDYMSKIVTNGIQYGGIEDSVPEAISKDTYDRISMFFTDGRMKTLVNESYSLADGKSSVRTGVFQKYAKKYPAIENEAVYILERIDKDYRELISVQFAKAFMIDSAVSAGMQNGGDSAVQLTEGFEIPEGSNIYDVFDNMTDSQRIQALRSVDSKMDSIDGSTLVQAGCNFVKNEYVRLGADAAKLQQNYIITIGITMLALSLAGAAASVLVCIIAARVAAGFCRDLRSMVFTKVEYFSGAEFDKFSTASLITRTTNDITQIQLLIVMVIRMACYAPIIGIGGIIRAVGKATSMSWIIALALTCLVCLIALIFLIALPKFKRIQLLVDKINLVTRENLSGMMVIRAFNTQKVEEERFDKVNRDITKTNLFVNKVIVTMIPFMNFLMNMLTLIIVWVGGHQIANSTMQVGDMMAFMQYAVQIIMAFLMLSMMFILIPRASVSASRVSEILSTENTIKDTEKLIDFNSSLKGEIEFRDVSFAYPGADESALEHISFKAIPGKTTAIIGSTGAGKSTLVNLIMRFYDVTSGRVLVDGVDVRDIPQYELREKIGYVPQKAVLFSGTVESNLRYSDENASDERVSRAAEIAQASHFIGKLPDGFKSDISQGGTNVSGGQKQRLSIARALVKEAEIYIFDDSFSALDFKTDANLRRALKSAMSDVTVIIVAQRISTIKNAEQIIVLNDGRVDGIGTHSELMRTCETYREIALSQLSEEELS